MTDSYWHRLREVQREGFAAVLPDDDFLNAERKAFLLTGGDDLDGFIASHRDPNVEVGGRFNANQEYHNPRLTVAVDRRRHQAIGYMYSAFNVSGGGPPQGPHIESLKARGLRFGKRVSIHWNILWLREVAVDPDYQGRGVATQLAWHHLHERLWSSLPGHRVRAYTYPEQIPFLQPVLESRGFEQKGDAVPKSLFGDDQNPVMVTAMEAPSIARVCRNLLLPSD